MSREVCLWIWRDMAKGDQINSIIGEGSAFEGKFYIAGDLKIEGKFEGDIKTESTLVVGESGKVKTANISAREIIMSGTMIGDIYAREEVKLTHTGKMLGDIHAPSVNISRGVIYKGNVNITGGHKKKDIQKIVEESFVEFKGKEENFKGVIGKIAK